MDREAKNARRQKRNKARIAANRERKFRQERIRTEDCPDCGGLMTWCSCCEMFSKNCCEHYGTCQCS